MPVQFYCRHVVGSVKTKLYYTSINVAPLEFGPGMPYNR